MKVQSTNITQYTTSNKPKQNFKALWNGTFCDALWCTGMKNYKAGNGKRFFEAMKNISKIGKDDVLTMQKERSDVNDYYEILTITNLTKGTSVKKRLSVTTDNYHENFDNEQSYEILKFLEELIDKKSGFSQRLFGKHPISVSPATQGKRYIPTDDEFVYMNKNIHPFFYNKYSI